MVGCSKCGRFSWATEKIKDANALTKTQLKNALVSCTMERFLMMFFRVVAWAE